ncbi:MAG: hypothetical protein AAFX54_02960 [Pseudomonadota bacterium]
MKPMLALLLLCIAACSSTIPPSNCKTRPGLINGPIVADRATAIAIASAVLPVVASDEFERIAEEHSDHWSIAQIRKDSVRETDEDTLIITAGGGGGELKIAKCDGRIFDFHYIR